MSRKRKLMRRLSGPQRHRLSAYFSQEELQRITDAVKSAESKTTGEIRVKIIEDCSGPVRIFAEETFFNEGLDRTKDRTGVLLLLVLKRRAIEILGDAGIDTRIDQAHWQRIVDDVSARFRSGLYVLAVEQAVHEIGDMLQEHFPVTADDVDELPDEPIVSEEA